MKTLEQVKKEVREEFDMLDGWNIGADTSDELFFERVCKKYAQSCCEYLRQRCADEAEIHWPVENNLNPSVNEQSILNIEIILP